MMASRRLLAWGALASSLLLASPSLARTETTPVGEIEATIGDAPYVGATLDVPSEGTSTAEYQSFGPVLSISIQAHDPQSDSIMHNVLSVEISLMGTDASASLMDGSSVSWWPKGMSEPFYMSENSGQEPEIVLEALSLEEGAARARGRFSARMCRQDGFTSEPDLTDCLTVEGRFDTALRKGG
ncbi:MAG: hypothetical protein CML67_13755 [Rhodobacteraceae bacterium]|nr:hypothetical protein [Paracoccaceae bacterium]